MKNQEIKTKKCRKCGRELPASEFYVKKGAADGLQAWCKKCQKTEAITDLPPRLIANAAIPTLRNLHRVN